MNLTLDALPYRESALEPYIGARTVELHYHMHHAGYLEKLTEAVVGTPWAGRDLEGIICDAVAPDIFNNAAQTWNHTFYWKSLTPPGHGDGGPGALLMAAIQRSFGTAAEFRTAFASAAASHFGSGWVWILARDDGGIDICCTSDADNPLRHGRFPLLTLDVWEHAYYLDYQYGRARYIDAFLDELISWKFAERNLREFRLRQKARTSA
jgi:Fe-Mn family superoxide dismutase